MGFNPSLEHARISALIDRSNYRNHEEIRTKSRQDIEKQQRGQKKQYDKRKYVGHAYDVGEVVVIKAAIQATGESTKLHSKYKGPYIVIEILPSDTYRIKELDEKRKRTITAHVYQMKSYYNHNESEDENPEEEEEKEGCTNRVDTEERGDEEGKDKDEPTDEENMGEEDRHSECLTEEDGTERETMQRRSDENADELKVMRKKRQIQRPARLQDYNCDTYERGRSTCRVAECKKPK